MIYLCTAIVAVFFAFSYALYKQLYNPLVFLNGMFTVILAGAAMGLFGISKENSDAALLVMIGTFCINIGFVIGQFIHNQKHVMVQPHNVDIEESQEVNVVVLIVIVFVMIYFSLHYIQQTITLLARGYSLNMVRLFYFNNELMGEATGVEVNGLIGYGTVYLYSPLQYICMAMTSMIWFEPVFMKSMRFWRKVIPIVTISNIAVSMLTNGGRMILYFFLICIGIQILVKRKKRKMGFDESNQIKKTHKKRNIFIVVGIASMVYVAYSVSLTRNESNITYSLLKSIYVYFCGCIPNLNIDMELATKGDYSFGITLVSGLIRPLFTGLRFLFGFPVPQVFSIGDSYLSAASHTNIIGNGITYNAFVTLFYYFYRDLGYVGVILESCLLGIALAYIYFGAGRGAKSYMHYLIVMQGIAVAFIRYQLMAVGYAMAFYFVILLFSKNRINCTVHVRK